MSFPCTRTAFALASRLTLASARPHTSVAPCGCSFEAGQGPSGSCGSPGVPVSSHPAALALGSSEQTPPTSPAEAATNSVIKPSGKGCHGTKSEEMKLHLYCCSGASGRSQPLCLGWWDAVGCRGPHSPPAHPWPLPHVCGGVEASGWGSWTPALGPCLVPSSGIWDLSLWGPWSIPLSPCSRSALCHGAMSLSTLGPLGCAQHGAGGSWGGSLKGSYRPQAWGASPAPQTCWLIASPPPQCLPALRSS